jgi:hypothetical protein
VHILVCCPGFFSSFSRTAQLALLYLLLLHLWTSTHCKNIFYELFIFLSYKLWFLISILTHSIWYPVKVLHWKSLLPNCPCFLWGTDWLTQSEKRGCSSVGNCQPSEAYP